MLAMLGEGRAGRPRGDWQTESAWDWNTVTTLAAGHGIAACLHQAVARIASSAAVPPDALERLLGERRATAMCNLRYTAELKRIADAMSARGIPLLVLKGMHLAELVYGDISLRPMSDIDLLVPRGQVAAAVEALQELDYGTGADSAAAVEAALERTCALGFTHRANQVYVELHWKLSEPGDGFEAPMDEIWRSAVPASLGGAATLVMSPEFLLLHVCAHLACKHVFILPLRALVDIDLIVRTHPALDWAQVVALAGAHGWGLGVALALRLAHEQLDTPVPDAVLASIGAAAIEPALLDQALAQMLAAPLVPAEVMTSPNFLDLAGVGFAARLRKVLARLFLSRAELALLYGVPERSPRLLLYYAVRLRDLLLRYSGSAGVLLDADSTLAAVAARRASLAAWMRGGAA